MPEVVAKSTFIRQSPRKLRLVADQIRGLKVEEAVTLLENLRKRAARPILLTLKQGVGNAVNNFNLKKEGLKIKSLEIGEGPRYKRMDKSHRAFRWGTIQKRTAHIRMILEGEELKEQKTKKLRPRRGEAEGGQKNKKTMKKGGKQKSS